MAQYKLYKIQIEGRQDYIAGVTACLDTVDAVTDGRKLLQAISSRNYQVSIQDTVNGNSCGAQSWSAFPLLPVAIKDKNAASFTAELKAAVDKAKSGGITLEHLGRLGSTEKHSIALDESYHVIAVDSEKDRVAQETLAFVSQFGNRERLSANA